MEKHIRVLVLVAAVMLAAAVAAPAPRKPRSVDVQSAQGNKTLCPYQVEVDDNPDRVPRRIKVIKCLHPASERAPLGRHHHKHKCEELTTHAQQRGGCVELHDEVLVHYRSEHVTKTYDVPVGCTCMFLDRDNAVDPDLTIPR